MDQIQTELTRLLVIVQALRHPATGCPWDRAQTLSSIQENIVEEATEARDAIAKGDMENLSEELGDVLYNILLQCRLAEDAEAFSFSDVLSRINKKLVDRHPHVFAGAPMPKDADAALAQWKEIKKKEKKR